jgi:cytochrome c oxidase assembly factor CtaG
MMTILADSLELYDLRSPAWLIVSGAIVAYVILALPRGASPRQVGLFAAAAATFLIALASPLAVLASRYLFSAHMAQHLILLLIVPLCVILSLPAPAREVGTKRRPPATRSLVPLGWMAGVGAMWLWHIPALCTASMSSSLVFGVQTVSLLAAGTAFWWPVFRPDISRRMAPQVSVGYLFAGCLGCTLLGIYVTFSPVSICPLYSVPGGDPELRNLIQNEWGVTHRIDQQIGGLLMWVPACAVYLGAIMAALASWYRAPYGVRSISNTLATE